MLQIHCYQKIIKLTISDSSGKLTLTLWIFTDSQSNSKPPLHYNKNNRLVWISFTCTTNWSIRQKSSHFANSKIIYFIWVLKMKTHIKAILQTEHSNRNRKHTEISDQSKQWMKLKYWANESKGKWDKRVPKLKS